MIFLWIAAVVRLFFRSASPTPAHLLFNIAATATFITAATIITKMKKPSVEAKSYAVFSLIAALELIFTYQDKNIYLMILAFSALMLFSAIQLNFKTLLFLTAICNFACFAFCLAFPAAVFERFSFGQLVFMFSAMDTAFIFSIIIVFWARKQLEKSKRLAIEAENANIAKNRFLAAVSHEIRTPMNAIFGMTEIILAADDSADTDLLKADSQYIKIAGHELLSLINDILDVSKIEQGKMEIVALPYNAESLFTSIANLVIPKIENRQVLLEKDFDFSAANFLIGDDVRIKQCCLSLLHNAIKFTKRGKITFSVKEKFTEDGIDLIISVTDTGIGIKEEELAGLFDNAIDYNLKTDQTLKGIGLGLFITGELTRLMGGKITVSSVYNQGSTFVITIPQKISSVRVQPGAYSNTFGKLKIKSASILVVDDNETNLEIARGLFRTYGTAVDTASSGFAALEMFKAKKYDIIFMDYMMPQMDGIETVKKIREQDDEWSKNIPIIALSANADASPGSFFLQNSFNASLSKPISVIDLERILKNFLPCELLDIYEKEEARSANLIIPGVDTEKGARQCGGENAYLEVLKVFHSTSTSHIEQVENAYERGDLSRLAIEMHSLKSIAFGIGADSLGALAKIAEAAARSGEKETFEKNFGSTLSEARRVLDEISALLVPENSLPNSTNEKISEAEIAEIVARIKKHSAEYDLTSALSDLEELERCSIPEHYREHMANIRNAIMNFSYTSTDAACARFLSVLHADK